MQKTRLARNEVEFEGIIELVTKEYLVLRIIYQISREEDFNPYLWSLHQDKPRIATNRIL